MLGWYYSNPLNHADKVNSITILVSESSVLSFCELQVFFYSRCLDICDIWRQFYFVFIWDKCPFAPERDLKRHHVIPEAVIQPDSGPDVYKYYIYVMIWKHIFHFLYHISISIILVTVLLLLLSILLYQYINSILWCVYIISVV